MKKTFISKESELNIIELLKSLITDYYKYVIEREKEICAFGIFTDSDISGFVLNFNTPDNTFEIDSDKWWMPEWKSGSINDKAFFQNDNRHNQLAKIMDELREKTNWDFDEEKNTFAIYKKEMFDCMCDALNELNREKLFKEVSKDFYLLVQEMDNGIYDGREISLQKIMSEKQFDEYRKFQ